MRILILATLCLTPIQVFALSPVQCELDKLGSNDQDPGDALGGAVALFGERALIGARGDDEAFPFDSGAAYVFDTTPFGLRQSAKLLANDLGEDDEFGHAVAIGLDTAVVTTGPGPKGSPGAGYFFELGLSGWSQTAKVSGGGFLGAFGSSVSLAGDTAAIGASGNLLPLPFPGSVLVFERSGGGWVQATTLQVAAPFTADEFGRSVSMSGDRILVGASEFGSSVFGFGGAGAAYVFDRDDMDTPGDPLDDTWSQSAKLTASDGMTGDLFGWSVSLSGDTAIVGAFADADAGGNTGAAYVFELGPGGWSQVAKLTASDAGAGDEFGRSVALSGTTALVGAPLDDDGGVDAGAVYVFERMPGGWSEVGKHRASDAAPEDGYGSAVALAGDTALVGSPSDEDEIANSGSAYALSIAEIGCPLLLASPGEVSLATGGDQHFVLAAGRAHAGRIYLIMASATGTSPGFVHDGFLIPLNIDSYTLSALAGPNLPPFTDFLGFLDAQGTAQAKVSLPTGLAPALAGLALNHAFLAFDSSVPTVAVTSAAEQLVLVP